MKKTCSIPPVVAMVALALVRATMALQTTPDLGGLATDDGDRTNYQIPVLTCHNDFDVTIEAGDWALIAVEGYELDSGNYGYSAAANPMCVSATPYATLHYDLQLNCTGGGNTLTIKDNVYKWNVRARAEWMVETQQDRIFPMECTYSITGEAQWDSVTKGVTQVISTKAPVEATRNVIISGSEINLVNANDADDSGTPGVWGKLDSVQVGQEVRFRIDTTLTGWHKETPYVGVTGCWFYDRDPTDTDAMKFDLVNQNGCNKPPKYYDPFTAAETPRVNGMLLNKKPKDTIPTGTEVSDPMIGPQGYLSGDVEKGIAYSDKLKMFKFPGTGQVWAKCTLRFCVEATDPRCITPNCVGKYYTGASYANGGDPTLYRRRRSAGNVTTEEVITVIAVTSAGTTTKIGVNGPGDMLTLESSSDGMDLECETKFYAVLAVTICLGLALLGILIVYLFKRASQRISPVDKARIIEDHYGRPTSVGSAVGGGMYGGGGMRMQMMGGNGGGGLPMISK
jgi:hypothetical protein